MSQNQEGQYISQVIRQRIKQAGVRFNANDNIADYIEPGELALLQEEVQAKMVEVLNSVVIDTETDFISLGVAQKVAAEMGATYYHLAELSDSAVIHIAQQVANC